MIFSRRSLQSCLDDIRGKVDDAVLKTLIAKLNRANEQRLPAMWELLVIRGLIDQGDLTIEEKQPTGREPDLSFAGDISFVADITTVSDKGRDEVNPYDELSQQIEKQKTKLGLPIGGVDIRVGHYRERAGRGQRTNLKLPRRGKIANFVAKRIIPEVKRQIPLTNDPILVEINEPDVEVTVSIKRHSDGYSSGGFAAYSSPQSLDRNPLYNALKSKYDQLRNINGYTGIIVCDSDTECLRKPSIGTGYSEVTGARIIEHFLNQNSSIDFVLAITIHEERRMPLQFDPVERRPYAVLRVQKDFAETQALEDVCTGIVGSLPTAICTPLNGARRALEQIPQLGFHGGCSMSSGGTALGIAKVKISAREWMDLMSGKITFERLSEMNDWAAPGSNEPGKKPNPFLLANSRGQLPVSINVISGVPKDDDWIEIEFGPPDAAVSKFH